MRQFFSKPLSTKRLLTLNTFWTNLKTIFLKTFFEFTIMGGSKKNSRVTRPSQTSVGSIGMGTGAVLPATPAPPPLFDETRSNLVAEGKSSFDRSLYNIVQYVFCCSKHNKVAITPTANTGGIIWIPFAVLPPDQTWEEASEHGLGYFFGKHTAVDTVEGRRVEGNGVMPKYEMNIIELLRVQLPSERVEVRMTIVVKLLQTEGLKCCQNTSNLQWEDYAVILESASTSSTLGKFWSGELKNYGRQLKLGETRYIYEFSIADAMSYFNRPDRKNSVYGALLKATAINHEKVMALYESFLSHCSPAFSMSAESFGRYLAKFGVDRHSASFKDLFRGACFNQSKDESMKWFEFLFAIICIDPKTKSHEARHRLIFRMADKTSAGTLTKAAFTKMAADAGLTKARLNELHAFDRFTGDIITVDSFCRWNRETNPPELDNFCRVPKSVLASVVQLSKEVATTTTTAQGKINKGTAARVGRGTCEQCRAQDFKYCLHCVLIDEAGHCSQAFRAPNKAFVKIKTTEVDSERYSAEYRFADNSVVVFFFKLITSWRGLPPDNMEALFENMTSLFELTKAVFASESRLLKSHSPAVIVGDLQGSINTALTVQQMLAPMAPDPDKVLLLRGFNENGPTATAILQSQCEGLFGRERGLKMMELMLQTFERMPLAVVIEDLIFVAHSGFPVTNPVLRMLLDIPPTLRRIEDNPTAFELISKVPVPKQSAAQPLLINQFTGENLATFLQVNSLSTLIRSAGGGSGGRQQSQTGTDAEVHFDGSCLSVVYNASVPTVCYLDPGKRLECLEVEDVSPSIQFVRLIAHF
ncbi:hypothetical protein TYRP_021944 [Tyrophagus putrescentiae]|nr:hypothetical protein TYRP_021944 [Tyrophagus putrescentiae]